jgi:DNA polymerase III subunit alpha
MRRLGVVCHPPCINVSIADFSVEPHEDGLAVRYALGALKGVGEGAMEQLCAERDANGPFGSLDEFADRISPRLLNRRQIESLAGGGAFDVITPNRAGVHAVAETLLAVAAEAEETRVSGQGGLFGGEDHKVAAVKLPDGAHWSMAERMAQEKEAFGFYFSAHPVDRYRHLADAHGARSYAALCSQPAPVDGSRSGAMMAALVEDVRWRTSARGRRYAMATLSDASGQFIGSCFDDDAAKMLEEAAGVGTCGLVTVELDRQPGEETPRVTVKRFQRFDGLAANTRLKAVVTLDNIGTVAALGALMAGERGGRGELIAALDAPDGTRVNVRLGRDFALDAEVAARIEALPGVGDVSLAAADSVRLALVS